MENNFPDGYSSDILETTMRSELPKKKYHHLLAQVYSKYGLDFFKIHAIKFRERDYLDCCMNIEYLCIENFQSEIRYIKTSFKPNRDDSQDLKQLKSILSEIFNVTATFHNNFDWFDVWKSKDIFLKFFSIKIFFLWIKIEYIKYIQ